jgi:L-iditol 2-dehydrogenase
MKMKVAVYYNNHDVRIEEREVPAIGAGELLLRVESSGLCGSDVMEWYRAAKAPLVLGHELTGVVEQVGEGVTTYTPGDRVYVTHHVPCNTCRACLMGQHSVCPTLRSTTLDPGGFAQYARVPAINVDRGMALLPDNVTFDEGSFVEPLACVVRGQRLADVRPGLDVLVIGAGLSGLLHIQLARVRGAARVAAVDVAPARLDAAARFGADAVFEASDDDLQAKLRDLFGGHLADRVAVCAGVPSAYAQAWQCVEPGGTVLVFAPPHPEAEVPFPMWDLWKNNVSLIPTYAGPPIDTGEALALIGAHRLDLEGMITHRLPIDETAEGFRLAAEATDCLKVVVHPHA